MEENRPGPAILTKPLPQILDEMDASITLAREAAEAAQTAARESQDAAKASTKAAGESANAAKLAAEQAVGEAKKVAQGAVTTADEAKKIALAAAGQADDAHRLAKEAIENVSSLDDRMADLEKRLSEFCLKLVNGLVNWNNAGADVINRELKGLKL